MKIGSFFWLYFKKYKLSFVIVIALIFISTISQVLFPIFIGKATEELVRLGQTFLDNKNTAPIWTNFNSLMGSLFLAFVCIVISNLIYMTVVSRTISYSTDEMRKGLFRKLSTLTLSFFDKHQDGDILSRFTSDLDNILQALNENMAQVIINLFLYIELVVIMFFRNATLAWVTIASTPIAFLILVVVIRLAGKYTDLQQKEVGKLNAYMDEMISAQKIIIVQGMQKEVVEGFVKQNNKVRSATFKGRLFSGLLFPIMNGLSLINTAVVIFLGTVLLIDRGNIEIATAIGLITTFSQFSQQYYQPIIQIAASWGSLQLALTGVSRVQELFDAPEEIRPQNAPKFAELKKGVEIKSISFSYDGKNPILTDVSISAPKGKMIAVVGPTGSGKTTIMNLLNRFYDVDKGSIEFDGQDIREYDLASLRSKIGIVLQDSVLFTGTIRDNIAFGLPNASQESVEKVARATHIHDYIDSLPDKYDTVVDDEQTIFSTGQKQLISIARTLLTNPQILILDEATSNVDTVTESRLQQAMEVAVAGRTSFVIAHRLKTILNADRIIVLKDGEVIEQGNHHELLKLNGFYAELYHNQFVFE